MIAILVVAAALVTLGSTERPTEDPFAGQATAEAWVGCWALEHREDWAPNVTQPGFPTGSSAPAPRLVLLDRLPGLRSNLSGAQGARSYRAEWIGSTLRGTEAWALRPDGNVYLENTPGVRVISAVLQGPPTEGEAPTMWFFRRTDTNLPEIRSLAMARRVSCPEGKAPHRQVTRDELAELLPAGAAGTFVYYDGSARRITRTHASADAGLPLGTGSARTSAWNQVARLVDEGAGQNAVIPLREQAMNAEAGTAWIAGRTAGPDGRIHGYALHLHQAPAAWLDEAGDGGEVEKALAELLERLLEGVAGG